MSIPSTHEARLDPHAPTRTSGIGSANAAAPSSTSKVSDDTSKVASDSKQLGGDVKKLASDVADKVGDTFNKAESEAKSQIQQLRNDPKAFAQNKFNQASNGVNSAIHSTENRISQGATWASNKLQPPALPQGVSAPSSGSAVFAFLGMTASTLGTLALTSSTLTVQTVGRYFPAVAAGAMVAGALVTALGGSQTTEGVYTNNGFKAGMGPILAGVGLGLTMAFAPAVGGVVFGSTAYQSAGFKLGLGFASWLAIAAGSAARSAGVFGRKDSDDDKRTNKIWDIVGSASMALGTFATGMTAVRGYATLAHATVNAWPDPVINAFDFSLWGTTASAALSSWGFYTIGKGEGGHETTTLARIGKYAAIAGVAGFAGSMGVGYAGHMEAILGPSIGSAALAS